MSLVDANCSGFDFIRWFILALFMLESKNISSILVTNDEGRMTTIFQRSDIFKLDIMDISLFEKPLYAIPALVVAVAGHDP